VSLASSLDQTPLVESPSAAEAIPKVLWSIETISSPCGSSRISRCKDIRRALFINREQLSSHGYDSYLADNCRYGLGSSGKMSDHFTAEEERTTAEFLLTWVSVGAWRGAQWLVLTNPPAVLTRKDVSVLQDVGIVSAFPVFFIAP
jgi:hypothetical protein